MKNTEKAASPISAIGYRLLLPRRLSGIAPQRSRSPSMYLSSRRIHSLNHNQSRENSPHFSKMRTAGRNAPAYDYDNPSLPFTTKEIAAIDSIKEFLSDSELAQARRLETVYYNPMLKTGGGMFIPGLRTYETSFCLYLRRVNQNSYEDLLKGFLDAVYEGCPKATLGGVNWPWFRVTTPNGDRHYPLEFNGNIPAWIDRMIAVALEQGTTMAWFERGKFCFTDGRTMSFGDLLVERLEGGKYIPDDW